MCASTHMLGGSGGMLSQKIFKFRCSEIASEAIFVLKFIFLFFLYLDVMPLEYQARVFLERCQPCDTTVGHW